MEGLGSKSDVLVSHSSKERRKNAPAQSRSIVCIPPHFQLVVDRTIPTTGRALLVSTTGWAALDLEFLAEHVHAAHNSPPVHTPTHWPCLVPMPNGFWALEAGLRGPQDGARRRRAIGDGWPG